MAPVETGGAGGFVNPPLFQQVDVEVLNKPGAARDAFLLWVKDNAPGARRAHGGVPRVFRAASQATDPVVKPRVPLSLAGLDPASRRSFPNLRQKIEVVGCAVCHTADADFVQTDQPRR